MTCPALILRGTTAMGDPLRWEAPLGLQERGLVTRVLHPVFPGMPPAGLPAGQDGRQADLPLTLEGPLVGHQVGARQAEGRREDLPAADQVPAHTPTHKEGTTMARPPTRTARVPSTRGRPATLNSTG